MNQAIITVNQCYCGPSAGYADESMSEANKTASLERAPTMETMSTSVTAETSEEQGALIPPKKKPMGVGMPGMPGMPGGLLAEMQKRNNKVNASLLTVSSVFKNFTSHWLLGVVFLQEKNMRLCYHFTCITVSIMYCCNKRCLGSMVDCSATKGCPEVLPSVVKTEDTRPALKPATPSPTSEGKKEGVVPPVRPTPPKPQPAPREASTSTEPSPAVKPSKPPLLRPKPPPKLKPKPSANTRPTTMMDMSTTGISKTAPPKPPPPDPSKRQTYIAPKITSSADSSPLTSPELNTDKPSRPPRSSADFHIKQHDTAATAVPGADAALLSPSAKSPRPARPPSISFKSSAEAADQLVPNLPINPNPP
ncbi:hypothetical protein EB796_009785 [Bugula neritina]|uniref:Uncharacterized protein n=1 Tax=Bugula neritina TaxID=10212 RepID=A0A7J7K121_BUGNE|nr:hypothetical protein EB796_009785 [Bugula neritina]